MIAAGVIGVAGERIVVKHSVESEVFAADSSQQLSRNGLGKLGSPDGIERVENRTVGLRASVQTLACPPGQFAFDPYTVDDENVCTEAWVGAASQGREQKSPRGRGCARRERAHAKSCIDLLSVGGSLKKAEYKKGGDQG